MKQHFIMHSCASLAITALANFANAGDLLIENFTGLAGSTLNGRSPAINLLSPGSAWVADPVFAANGQVNDGTNTDRGAYLDLGAGFSFQPNESYSLTISWSNLNNSILFAGFSTTSPTVGNQTQTQGTNFAVRARLISAGTDTIASWKNPGTATNGTAPTPAAGTAALTLNTGNLSNATFTVNGLGSPVSIDLTSGYRYLWIAFEDPTSASPASDAKIGSLSFTGPVPAPPPTITVSPDSGVFRGNQTVTLSSESAPASIHYTLDGSPPDATSFLYGEPILLSQSTTLRAVAIHPGGSPGPMISRDYVILPAAVPNILIIVGDDVGYGDLQCYGAVNTATPHLDGLALDGIRFSQFTTTGPGDAACQFALLTGRAAARGGFGAEIAPGQKGILAEEWTLGETLRKKGYRTGFIGQWNLGDTQGSHPNDQGFGLFHGLPYRLGLNAPLEENRQILSVSPDPSSLLDNLTTRARSFIADATQEPFALVFQPPPLPAIGTSIGGPHANRIEALDAAVGGLLGELNSHGLRENTLVVFLAEGGAPRTINGGSNSLLRDGAGTNWEGGVRCPLLLRWPGVVPAGQFNLSIIGLTDLLPTLSEIVGAYQPSDRPSDGVPRSAFLLGLRSRPNGDERVFTYRHDGSRYRPASIRLGKWKHHLSMVNIDPENTNSTNGTQLYDLHVDASESINRSGEQSAVLAEMQAIASQHEASLPAPGSSDVPAPKSPLLGPAETSMTGHGPATIVSFGFDRPRDSLNDHFRIEHSDNLHAWNRLPIPGFIQSALDLPNEAERIDLLVPLNHPELGGSRRFIRLAASRPISP